VDFGEALFQPFPTTRTNRYPALFDALAERLAPLETPRILSFGCASGEEVRALRMRFPHARITGIDANARAIARARAADGNPRSAYRHGATVPPTDQYDAILALAVFRHGELEELRPDDCAQVMPFARFDAGLTMLDACLAPGGYLAIANSHFRFRDASVSAGYTVDPLPAEFPARLCYGPDDRMIDSEPYAETLFRKS
jgi:hypothetical protein